MGSAEGSQSAQVQTLSQATNGWHSNTYGCLEPYEIGPLEALLDDVKRTYAHILWLERYIAYNLAPGDVFAEMSADQLREREQTRAGRPTSQTAIDADGNQIPVPGSMRWFLMVERKKQTQVTRRRSGVHPAIRTLLDERRHLADITTKALHIGIKLDQIDFSRKQADLIVGAMGRFAISQGLSPTDPDIAAKITDALEHVLAQDTNEQHAQQQAAS